MRKNSDPTATTAADAAIADMRKDGTNLKVFNLQALIRNVWPGGGTTLRTVATAPPKILPTLMSYGFMQPTPLRVNIQ